MEILLPPTSLFLHVLIVQDMMKGKHLILLVGHTVNDICSKLQRASLFFCLQKGANSYSETMHMLSSENN